MSFTVEKMPGAPIILYVQHTSDIMPELEEALASMIAALDEQPEPAFMIFDVRGISMGLDDLTKSATMVSRGAGALLHHANLREGLMVSTDGMIKLAAKGLKSAAFGGVNLPVFDTPEHALEYCWQRIAETADGSARAQAG